ncbi:MAG: DUF3990 domain-containing protein [Oscillospiraceae bacterium]|nr:DUF3990 domain-containing protein [Oscillospiraceae bacterium]
MITLSDNLELYHGSYTEVSVINLSKCSEGLDFGKGFYVTSSQKQAISYVPSSVRKAKRREVIPENFDEADGRISVYCFHAADDLLIHCFEDADAEWLHFAACNRSKSLFPELRKKYAAVDIIGGKVADDVTAITLNNYVAGAYGVPGTAQADRIAIELLESERLTDQFCFRTPDAIRTLAFLRSDSYGDVK